MSQRFILITLLLVTQILSCKSGDKARLPEGQPPLEKKAEVVEPLEPAALNLQEGPPQADKFDLGGKAADQTRLSGQVSSLNKRFLVFKTAGTIEKMPALPGMFFKQGENLANLYPEDHKLKVKAAELRLEQAINQKKLVEREFKTEKQLRAENINSEVQLDNATINFENATITVAMAENELKIAKKALSDTALTAPFDCVISRQIKHVGESSMGGSDSGATYEIYEFTKPELFLHAPESLLGRVQIGDEIEINVPALNEKMSAKVVRYVPVITENTRTFLVVAHLDQEDKRIVPGYFIEGLLKVSRKAGKSS